MAPRKVTGMKINGQEIAEAKINGKVVFRKELIPLNVNITYDYQWENERVLVTIIANKPIKQISGWQVQTETTQVHWYYRSRKVTAIVEDFDGNILEVTITIDMDAPTITVKTGENETVGNFETNTFSKVSFKLYDNFGLSEYELNGVKGYMSVSQWSDLNNITSDFKGAVLGLNKLIVRDTSGNETEFDFTLIGG